MNTYLVWKYIEQFPVAPGDEESAEALGPRIQTEGSAISVGPTVRAGR